MKLLKLPVLAALMLAGTVVVLAAPRPKPKLVVAIMVDQFRYEYLVRFRNEYHGGLDRLLKEGAVFRNAHYEHFPTVTAVGHSTFLSGATPSISGIIGNDWFDRTTGKTVTSVSDPGTTLLGVPGGTGSSPNRLLSSTVGDELKIATSGKAKVIGISLKDRAAILPAGHMADGAYWVDKDTGNFVSSTFYFPHLPDWVRDFNQGKPADKYLGASWDLTKAGGKLTTMAARPDPKFYDSLPASPWGNELIEAFAERAVQAMNLGADEVTDILAVSFSSNDYVGHRFGPDSPEVHDMCIRTDALFDKFFQFLDAKVGLQNILIVMSADHGVAALPELTTSRKMPGGRMPPKIIQQTIEQELVKRFGEGKWILSPSDHSIYLNRELIAEKGLARELVEGVAAEAARSVPHVARVYTGEQLVAGNAASDAAGRRILNGYNGSRGADLVILLEPYWMYGSSGTTHGSPYVYDTHVPVIFYGPGLKPGSRWNAIAVNDIAPTLSAILQVEPPSGSSGRVLAEILE